MGYQRSRRARRARLATAVVLFGMTAVPIGVAAGGSSDPPIDSNKIETSVRREVAAEGEASFFIEVAGRPDLSAAAAITDWAARGQFVYDTLREFADARQAGIRRTLDHLGVEYTPFFVSNTIYVTGGRAVLDAVAANPRVTAITAPQTYAIPDPIESDGDAVSAAATPQWGLDAIHAPAVWDQFGARGEDIVVANIDTGVQFDHPALVNQYRGNDGDGTFDHDYNWFDPSGVCGSPLAGPCDNLGHGTHTMGTMVGADGGENQIGVAPGAGWIAAKGCESKLGCSAYALLASAQWMLAPTDLNGARPEPAMRPHVVNNSWGGGPGQRWYMDVVDAWVASGIFPMFANGNSGPSCGTASSPGDYPQSHSAGAFDVNGNIAYFSSRGRSAIDGGVKPDIAAPGVNVRSSVPGNGYVSFSGTSMATPHVAGTVALLWSAAPALVGDIDTTGDLLDTTAVDTSDLTCGGTAGDNNVWGEGKLDALAAVEQAPRGDIATVTGTIADAVTGAPIEGATVTAAGPFVRTVTTDEHGTYRVRLVAGPAEVSVDVFGYAPASASVDLVAGETAAVDLVLDPLPTVVIAGTVADGSGHGWPLYARIDIDGYRGGPVFTDPATGRYEVRLPESAALSFDVSAVHGGYTTQHRVVMVRPDATTQDFAVTVDPGDCDAPGYDAACKPIPGGLVVGNVYDRLDHRGLDGATVAVAGAAGATVTSGPTPGDDQLDDGFYVVFSPLTGPTDISAGKARFDPATEPVDVVADAVVERDFVLGSGHLEVDPGALTADVRWGERAQLGVTIANAGTRATRFELTERDRGRAAVGDEAARGKPAGQGWQQTDPLPIGITGYGYAQCEGEPDTFYVLGGASTGGSIDRSYRYDAASETWTELAPMPASADGTAAACIDGRIHVIGGVRSNQHFVYDIASDTWSAAAPAPRNVEGAAGAAFGSKVFLVGGDDDGYFDAGISNQTNVYDIATDTWSEGAPMPVAALYAGAVQVGQFLYVVGGWDNSSPAANVNVTQRYDMSTDTWEIGPTFTPAKAGFALAATSDALYAMGGDASGATIRDATATTARLDLAGWPDGSWVDLGDPLPKPVIGNRAGFCTSAIGGGEIWSVGGIDTLAVALHNQAWYRISGESCGPVDVPWLTEDPAAGAIDSGARVDVTVTVDGSLVDQPGSHTALLYVGHDTPHTVSPVPVTMRVTPPDTWGEATGTVTGMTACDAAGSPVEGAVVRIGDTVVATDAAGRFEWWLEAGTYPVEVVADGYVAATGQVAVTAGRTAGADFDLRRDAPCPTVTPGRLELDVPLGGTATTDVTITNRGGGPYEFDVRARDLGHDVLAQVRPAELADPGTVAYSPPVKPGPASLRSLEAGHRPDPDPVAPSASDWQDGTAVPSLIARYAHAQCEGEPDVFYVIGGLSDGFIQDTNYRYDAATDTWTALAPMPTGGEGPAAACYDGRIYVMGGTGSNQHYVYDIASDTWSAAAPTPRGLGGAAAAAFDGKVVLVGGDLDFNPGRGVFDQTSIYDIATDTWSEGAPMPVGTTNSGAVQVGEFLYVVGGWGTSSPGSNVAVTQRYDISTDTWELGPAFPAAKSDFALAATADALYAIGGDADGGTFIDATATVHRVDLGDWPGGTWAEFGGALPAPRLAQRAGFCTTANSGGELWAVGGLDGDPIGGFDYYDDNLFRPSGEDCRGPRGVPWLGVEPATGTVGPDSGAVVTVTADASRPEVDQPGAYQAEIVVAGRGAPAATLPVTMNVTPPTTWGKVTGTVDGLSECDASSSPLAGATVEIGTVSVETDESGRFERWLPAGSYPVAVSDAGYVSVTDAIEVGAGDASTADFDLRLDRPCPTVNPGRVELTVTAGEAATRVLTVGNGGAAGYAFRIDETPLRLDPPGDPATAGSFAPAAAADPAPVGELSVRSVEREATAGTAGISAAAGGWIDGAELPGGLARYAHAQCDGDTNSFYVFSGVDASIAASDKSWRYDADTDTWTELAPIPSGQEGLSAACLAGRIHVMGGGGTTQHHIYDIAADAWSTGAPLPRPVWGAAMAALDGRVYLVGGDADHEAGSTSNAVDVYDVATDTWGTGSPMPLAAVAAGSAQAGRFLYVVGGFGDASPDANVAVTQRYDLLTDTWTTGPAFSSARADLALAVTDRAIYAMGGDGDGGGFFDASTVAERLDTTVWPDGAWTAVEDLPVGVTTNNGGFCTAGVGGVEVWSVGGGDIANLAIGGRTLHRNVSGETCATIRADVPWLSVSPNAGDVAADGSLPVEVTVDAAGLEPGEYHATVVVMRVPYRGEIVVPVSVVVEAPVAWVAVEDGDRIGGVAAEDEDVVALRSEGSASLTFDGSDVGLRGERIDAVAWSGRDLLLSLDNAAHVPGVDGTVDDSDIMAFTPAALGEDTSGTFSLWFDGSDVGFTSGGEDVNAVDLLDDGSVLVTTTGDPTAPGLSGADRNDIFRFVPTSLGANTVGSWSLHLDGSDVGLRGKESVVDALAVDSDGRLDVSTHRDVRIGRWTAQQSDVAVFQPTSLGPTTAGSFLDDLLVRGRDYGIRGNNITAVEVNS